MVKCCVFFAVQNEFLNSYCLSQLLLQKLNINIADVLNLWTEHHTHSFLGRWCHVSSALPPARSGWTFWPQTRVASQGGWQPRDTALYTSSSCKCLSQSRERQSFLNTQLVRPLPHATGRTQPCPHWDFPQFSVWQIFMALFLNVVKDVQKVISMKVNEIQGNDKKRKEGYDTQNGLTRCGASQLQCCTMSNALCSLQVSLWLQLHVPSCNGSLIVISLQMESKYRFRATAIFVAVFWVVVACRLVWNIRPDDGGSKELWNLRELTPVCTELRPRIEPSSYWPPWETQIRLTRCLWDIQSITLQEILIFRR
jgi:hypothetical protein